MEVIAEDEFLAPDAAEDESLAPDAAEDEFLVSFEALAQAVRRGAGPPRRTGPAV